MGLSGDLQFPLSRRVLFLASQTVFLLFRLQKKGVVPSAQRWLSRLALPQANVFRGRPVEIQSSFGRKVRGQQGNQVSVGKPLASVASDLLSVLEPFCVSYVRRMPGDFPPSA